MARTAVDELAELGVVPPVGEKLVELFGTPPTPAPDPIGLIDPISTADATDEAEAIALVNECKAKINEIISAAAGN